ncbi:MAG: type IV pilus modification PilV family protein [Armatimonadota bacterium]
MGVARIVGRRNRQSGFTTLEVLVALSLFSYVLVAIIGLLIGSVSTGATAEASSIASNLARQRLEELSGVVAQSGIPAPAPTPMGIAVPAGGRTYTVATTLSDLGNNVVNVQVTVSYQVTYASACVATAAGGESCTGNTRTYDRVLQTRVRRP